MSLWLNDEQLTELTGKKQNPKRVKALAEMRPPVKFRVRADGYPLVDSAQFETHPNSRKSRINWAEA